VQYYEFEEGPRFICGVADGGIGIRESLRKNPEFRFLSTDAHAIDLALEERVSGTGERNRGIGLHWVRETMAVGSRRLVIHSVAGSIRIEGPQRTQSRFARLFPGTAAYFWVPT
jgi:hypothetical protein